MAKLKFGQLCLFGLSVILVKTQANLDSEFAHLPNTGDSEDQVVQVFFSAQEDFNSNPVLLSTRPEADDGVVLDPINNPVRSRRQTIRTQLTTTNDVAAPPGTSSLVFVFDTTGSMYDDLLQVREGAKRIFATVLEQREKLIYNYVLVPFHDPEVGPVIVTTDTHFFQRKLQNLYVQGGGDCPEMTVSGIKMALEAALPASFVYVFTDARSKDYHLTNQVLNLIQQKQSQVVFVMTGDCGNRTHPGYAAYEKIASASSGQIFHLEKTDVSEVLKFVRVSVQTRKVNIVSLDREQGGTFIVNVPVDSHMYELTVSLSGNAPQVNLIDSDGQLITKAGGLETVLELEEVNVASVKNPKAGMWQLRTTAANKHSVRVTGLGAIDFVHGFASKQAGSIENTHSRPIKGVMTHMMINMTGLPAPGVATMVSLVDLYGKVLYENPLVQDKYTPYLYHVGPFLPPDGYYFVKAAGGPKAFMQPKTTAFRNQATNLSCTVESRAPFTLYWFKGEERIGGPLFFKYSETATWTLPEVGLRDRGEYRCVVISPAGNDSASTFLETREPKPHIIASRNVTVVLSHTAYLHCRTQSISQSSITWQRRGVPLQSTEHFRVFPNGTLQVIRASRSDDGPYVCHVITQGGDATSTVYLSVLEPPKAIVDPTELYYVQRGSFNMSCILTGDPQPEAEWYFKEQRIRPGGKYYITYKYDLIVRNAGSEDEGRYECKAKSSAGAGSDYAHAKLAVPPNVTVNNERVMIGRGDVTVLECLVTGGVPTPKVTWYRSGRELTSNFRYISINEGRLTIQGAQDSDAGMYSCIAENMAGRAEGRIRVDVGSIPVIVPSPDNIQVNIERDITLPCRATGHPVPDITWKKDGQSIGTGGRFQVLPDGGLLVRNTELTDGARFTCTATNRFGTAEAIRVLLVTGLISPVLGHVSPEEQVVESRTLRLSCVVVLGTPKPHLQWLKNGRPLRSGGNIRIEGGGSGLMITGASYREAGRYTCIATNAAGNATINVNVQVICDLTGDLKITSSFIRGTAKPVIAPDEDMYTVNQEQEVRLPCNATGTPLPTITWTQNGRPLLIAVSHFNIKPDGTLVIFRVDVKHAGTFVCTAANSAGDTQRSVKLEVRVAPTIHPDQTNYNVIERDSIRMSCEAQGDPKPQVDWYYEGEKVEWGTTNPDGSLTISRAEETQRGDYQCLASNVVGTATRDVTLDVHTAPVIDGSGELIEITVVANETATFPCPARAEPPPSREWTYEGRRVFKGYSYGSELRFTGDGALVIVKSQMQHRGSYRCVVSNLAGNDSITYLLKVIDPPRIVTNVAGTLDVVLNLMLEIPCRAIGTPKPTISWKKDGLEVLGDDEIQVDEYGTLRIEHSELSHAGVYVCTAKNTAGEDSRITNVVVQEPPKILLETETVHTSVEGERIEMQCLATGSPTPAIFWYRRGAVITGDETGIEVFPNDGRVILVSVSSFDHGPYLCKAVNPAGEAELAVKLTVIVPPDIPDQDIIIEESVLVGGPFSLYCPVFSTPIPDISWQLDNRPIPDGDPNVDFSEDKRRLHVLKSRVTDAGVYKCIARNPAGESTKTFAVEVLVPPNLDESKWKRKITVILSQSVTFGCPVSGVPDPDISWLANGQLLDSGTENRGVRISEDGLKITIETAQLDHQGSYTCVASNKAGSLDVDVILTVLSPPALGTDEVIEIVEGQMVTMNCNPREEGLKSIVTWLKDGSSAEESAENVNEALGGRRLFVMKGKVKNAGDYVCIVRNSAGESRKTFKLIVLVPPEFTHKDFEQNVEVTEGHPLTLSCHVKGLPQPVLTWNKNGETVSINSVDGAEFSAEGQILIIPKLYNGASNRFTCLAENKAGSVSRDFFVQIIAPPVFHQSGDIIVKEVMRGFSVTMECPVNVAYGGIDLQWLKDGRPLNQQEENLQISLDKTRLHMVNVEQTDEADYTCIARNPAGEATREFRLVVIVPPSIVGRMVEDITVIEGQSLTMQCQFEADPRPTLTWTKDGSKMSDRAQLLRDNATVYIPSSDKTDAGSYFCVVSNQAGQVEKTFNIRVILRPEILGSDDETTVEVLIRTPVTLDCPVLDPVGVSLSWLRHEQPLTQNIENIQILAGGRHLHIIAAKREDAGRFTCRAENEAGASTKKYRLIVLIPPTIIGEGGAHSVIENHTLVLPCETDGIPTPVISWTKGGAEAGGLDAVEVLSDGQQFRITHAHPNVHPGGYLCTATNKVGSADVGFDVDVISKPSVAQAIKAIVEVIVDDSADLRCPFSNRQYSGLITWLRDGRPIDPDLTHKYQISQSATKFHLKNAQLEDEGNYGCRVKNRAGETTVDFKLVVLEPPSILILHKDINRTVIENATVSLSCPAKGKPDPSISWYKNGELLNEDSIGRIIPGAQLIERNQLKNPRITVEDSGRYTCTATNKAGMAEQDITVYVMTPPRIEREGIPAEVEGVVGRRVTIPCPAFGRPPPEVTWLKAGRPMAVFESNIYFSASKQKLHFVSVSTEDLDRYTCVAQNVAGEDKRDFTLEVLVAPFITGTNLPRNIQVITGRSAMLECPANGSPRPTITWLKNGQPVEESETVRLLSDGRQLQVSNAQLNDTARYTCIASNPIGVVDLDIFMDVVGRPIIDGPDMEIIEVIESQSTQLMCPVEGTQPLDIEWLKGGESLAITGPRGTFVQISSQGRQVHFLAAQLSDEGRYTCIGRNQAGEARKNFELKVLVPPTINETASSSSLQTLTPGQNFQIECKVRGIPSPAITWLRDYKPFDATDENENVKFLQGNTTIWVSRANVEHAARYTCRATNKVGEAQKDFLVQLQGPPKVDKGVEKKEVHVGEYVILTCLVIGGSGDISVNWLVDSEPYDTRTPSPSVKVEDRRIEIDGARLSDTARYTCIVKNEAGEARKHFELTVLEPPRFLDTTNLSPSIILGRPLVLDCSVQGVPKPALVWSKDGVELKEGEGEFLNDQKQYRIAAAEEKHAGRYSCVAENKAGRAEKDLVVQVLMPPRMGDGRPVVEVPENETLTLLCPLLTNNVNIQWTKNGVPITTSPNLQLSTMSKKLHIMKASTADAGRFNCIAKNEAGQASFETRVITLVPPKIMGPGFRTMETIVNQTVQLECVTAGIPSPSIMWNVDNRPIVSSPQTEFINNGTVIRIFGIQGKQEGRYTCVAINKVGRAEADTFVEVISPPFIAPGPPLAKVILDQGQTIRCEVEGNPTPTVQWLKNGAPFRSALVHSSYAGHYIHIVESLETDAGRYTCLASNRAGEARRDVNLVVLVPPTIQAGERVLNVIENRTLAIECSASGSPSPLLSWSKEGRPLGADSENSANGRYEISNGRLTIQDAKTSDGGRYTCEAKNEAGTAQVDFSVDVYWRPKFLSLNPEIRVTEGERATLECKVDAKPRAEIRWLKGGRPLNPNSPSYILSPRGEHLMILNTKRTDTGSYSCVAKNPAGEAEAGFTLTVLVAPHIEEQIDQNPKVITDQSIIIQCPVLGIPDPKVEWRKNSRPVVMERGRVELHNQKHLAIMSAVTEDASRYTCHATNEAGELQTDYVVQVIAPPKLGPGVIADYEVIEGESITMDCNIKASPPPEFSWVKGDTPVYLDANTWISASGQELTISQARLTDGGRYTCKATNVAGTTNVEMILRVLVPPSIDKSNIIGNPLAIVNRTISLECPATGIPTPTVSWLKDGQPLILRDPRMTMSGNNQTLLIEMIRSSDQGRYTCVAENKAGRAEQDFNLEVLMPPRLGASGRQKIVIKEGESTVMTCPVLSQNPPPAITWTKDGRPLDPLTIPNIRFSSENRRLHINSAKATDEGIFMCIASNRAGESSLEFELEVLSPPVIDGSRNDPQPHVPRGASIMLYCYVQGRPKPVIRWLKDGQPLSRTQLSSEFALLEDNQVLRVNKAEAKHRGRYTCMAENPAGRDEHDVPLDIWSGPTVSISGEQTVAPLNSPIVVQCQGAGNPQPVLSWSKDGQVLLSSPDGARISGDGSRLDIPRLKKEDVGRYTCTGENRVGKAHASVDIDVLIPPKIMRDAGALNPILPAGQTLTVHCEIVEGKPWPTTQWYKDGQLLRPGAPDIQVAEDGRYIQISNVNMEHEGYYTCNATNPAGYDSVVYKVEIVEGPKIDDGVTVQVIEEQPATITCKAHGTPKPTIIWQRNGQRIDTRDRFIVGENTLQLTHTKSSDAGIYVCVATNDAGTAQQAYTLEVLWPPKIVVNPPDEQAVKVGGPLELLCKAKGYPDPGLEWFWAPIGMDNWGSLTGSRRFTVVDKGAEGGTSIMATMTNGDVGRYKCVAKNDAGIAEWDGVVKMISPPLMGPGGVTIVNVTQGDPAKLECDVRGEPVPRIAWYKDNYPLAVHTNPSMKLMDSDKVLEIGDTRLTDDGNFDCIAQNEAGNATQNFKLNVGVPPRITEEPRRVTVHANDPATLPCEAVGVPNPEISWTHDRSPVPTRQFLDSSVTFRRTTPEDAGVYTCQAKNWAGTGFKDVELVVLVPPQVYPQEMNMTVKENGTVVLPCNATGVPQPTVEWFKQSIEIKPGEKYRIYEDNQLEIKNAKEADGSYYRCLARNPAGVAYGHRRLIVDVPEMKYKTIWVECDNTGRPILTIYVPARGDVPDEDKTLLPWSTDYMDLPENGTNGILIRCLPHRPQDLIEESLVREQPILVELPKNQKLNPGDSIVLTCGAIGTPTPEITWLHNGTALDYQPANMKSGKSTVRIRGAKHVHAGDYTCLARNKHGSTRASASIRIGAHARYQMYEGAPEIARRSVTILSCESSDPKAKVYWTKGGRVVTTDSYVRVLKNGSLVVYDTGDEYELGRYKCVVKRKTGKVSKMDAFVDERRPDVTVYPQKVTAQIGGTSRIHCKVSADMLTTEVSWFRNKLPVTGNPKIRILVNDTIEIKDIQQEDRGIYRCAASNSMGHAHSDAHLVIQGLDLHDLYLEWSDWSVCSKSCGKGFRTRYRICLNNNSSALNHTLLERKSNLMDTNIPNSNTSLSKIDSVDINSLNGTNSDLQNSANPNSELEITGFDSADATVDGESDGCNGNVTDIIDCNPVSCSNDDMPSNMKGSVKGEINGFKLENQVIGGNVTPFGDSNQIFIRIQTLPLDLSKSVTGRGALGYVASPCWLMASRNRGAFNGYALTDGQYQQNSLYQFQSGENLKVQHSGGGVDSNGYLKLDVLVDGSVPPFPGHHMVSIDPYTEYYTQTAPGLVHGAGRSTLRIGPHFAVPLSWHHNISFDGRRRPPTPTSTIRVSAVDLVSQNAFSQDNFGYTLRVSAQPTPQSCPTGYSLDPNTRLCHDLNECSLGVSGCKESQECENTIGSYKCKGTCKEGYTLADNGTCTDVNECQLGLVGCESGTECVNTDGSYRCTTACPTGYRRNEAGHCQDVDECREQIPCHPEKTCFNTMGSYKCVCRPGYSSNIPGGPCIPVTMPNYNHDRNHHGSSSEVDLDHENSVGSGGCPVGYTWDREGCQDVDECAMRPCQHECHNTEGSYHCSCPPGYQVDHATQKCIDIDECSNGVGQCGEDSLCFNQRGGFRCLDSPCPDFYRLDKTTKQCLLTCLEEGGECPPDAKSGPVRIQIQLLSVPGGLSAQTDLLRLTAYDNMNRLLHRTRFALRNQGATEAYLPFAIRLDHGVGTVFATRPLMNPAEYRLQIRAVSFDAYNRDTRYQTDFLIFLSVSRYSF